jgi:hypothetical protein
LIGFGVIVATVYLSFFSNEKPVRDSKNEKESVENLSSDGRWHCPEWRSEIIYERPISGSLISKKTGTYCVDYGDGEISNLAESIWVTYKIELINNGTIISTFGSEGGVEYDRNKIDLIDIPDNDPSTFAVIDISSSASSIYTELTAFRFTQGKAIVTDQIFNPVSKYQASRRQESEYEIDGFYKGLNEEVFIDILVPDKGNKDRCNACAEYHVEIKQWNNSKFETVGSRPFSIAGYSKEILEAQAYYEKLSNDDQACFGSLVSSNDWTDYLDAYDIFRASDVLYTSIIDKDIEAITSFIRGELEVGPPKFYLQQVEFDQVFTKPWVDRFKDNYQYSCGHLKGYYMLGANSAAVWFASTSKGEPIILSLSGVRDIPYKNENKSDWKVDGKEIDTACYTTYWSSADNYEEFADKYQLGDFATPEYDHFVENIGLYLNNPIPVHERLNPWDEGSIGFSQFVESCEPRSTPWGEEEYRHVVYEIEDKGICIASAPHITDKCIDSKVVAVTGPFGYSNVPTHVALYSLFENEHGEKYVVPTMNFESLNHAITTLHGGEQ